MAVPKRKTSKSTTRLRRTHKKLGQVNLVNCSNCSEKKLPHQVCPKCGYYQGKQVVEVED